MTAITEHCLPDFYNNISTWKNHTLMCNVWWHTNNSSVQKSHFHWKKKKNGQWNMSKTNCNPSWVFAGCRWQQLFQACPRPGVLKARALLLLCIPAHVLASHVQPCLCSQGQASLLNSFMFSRHVIKHSCENFSLRHSWPFWNNAPVSINTDKNHIICVTHSWHRNRR